MLELLLYSGMMCSDADAIMLRIKANRSELPKEIVVELIDTVKDFVPECEFIGTQTTEGTGKRIQRKLRRLISPTSGENK